MLTVLITRPLEASQALARQLEMPGLLSVVMPFYSFAAHTPDINVANTLCNAPGRKLIVFTSPRAVEFGLALIPEAQRTTLEYATVGDATRRQLEMAGQAVTWQPASGYTSEDLLAIEGLRSDPGTAIVMCAPAGREVLKPGLEALGWVAGNALVYQRIWSIPATAQICEIVAADDLLSVWTSTSAIDGAEKTLPSEAWFRILAAPALAISSRIKHHLQAKGASEVSITGGPGNADLLQSIMSFVEHRI